MRTSRTLKPGQRGTKELLARHGATLLCVRTRYDEDTREHLRTVDLLIRRRSRDAERRGRDLDARATFSSSPTSRLARPASGDAEAAGHRNSGGETAVAACRSVALRIGLRERDLRQRVKSAGGRWDPGRKVWYLRPDVAERLDLLRGVVGGGV